MAASPELSQLLALSRDRTAYQNPLFQAVTQMAYQGLPMYARQGTQLSGTLSNQAPAAPSGGGGMNPALAGGLGALGGAALNSLGPNGNMLGALIDGLKTLFSHPRGIQGNKPYGGGALMGPSQDRSFTGWDPSVSNANGVPYLTSDPGVYWGENGTGAVPTDPSGGSGTGPGMQDFYAWLQSQQGGGEGDQGATSGGFDDPGAPWWEE